MQNVKLSSWFKRKKVLIDSKCRSNDLIRDEVQIRNCIMKQASPLYILDCFLDSNYIIRVGGRIHNAELNYGEIYPVVFPKGNYFSSLLIQHFHEKVKRQGRLMTQS